MSLLSLPLMIPRRMKMIIINMNDAINVYMMLLTQIPMLSPKLLQEETLKNLLILWRVNQLMVPDN